jgi:hypothetical protein
MKKFRISRGHPKGVGIGGVIGEIDRDEYERGAPGFAALVVRKDTGYPGGGYFYDADLPIGLRRTKNGSLSPKLTEIEKRHVAAQQERIWNYYAPVGDLTRNAFSLGSLS